MKNELKIGWLLSGSRNTAGARIQGWNMHDCFVRKGINSEIIRSDFHNYELNLTKEEINEMVNKSFDLIVLQKISSGENFDYFVEQAHKKGTKIVFIGIDKMNVEFAIKCDAIIVVSKFLKSLIPKEFHNKTFVVFDGYEHSKEVYKSHTESKSVKLVYVTNTVSSKFPVLNSLPKDVALEIIGPPEERVKKVQPDQKLFTDTPYKFDYIVWNLRNVDNDVLKGDIGIIPYDDKNLDKDYVKAKSANRLILFMSYGMPVIVSPTAEYKSIIKQGVNGFVAKNHEEWIKIIELLRDNPRMRKQIGRAARDSVKDAYSLEAQGELYLNIMKKTLK